MTEPLPGDIFTIGQVLNNTYQIDRVLGRGGTGEVYLASNQITGRQVAIKALNAVFSGNADYIELMKREEEMRAIQHPAVVRYTECSRSDDNHVFLVMDFVDGPALSAIMTDRQVDPRELLIIAHRVLEGLEATHRQGIIHRDLSPDNIVLQGGEPQQATLIDFGIAKDTAVGARTVVGSDFAGKYEYSAPEQFEGIANVRTDLYALGATLLAAFRGETPFARSTPGEIMRRKQSPLDINGVPQPLKGIIEKLSDPDPKARPESAAEMAAQVSQALNPGRKNTQHRKKSGRSPFAAVMGLAAVALVGALIWVFGFSNLLTPAPEPQTYRLTLMNNLGSPPVLNSLAPTVEDAALLRDAVAAAYGQTPGGDITMAPGIPTPDWMLQASDLLTMLAELERVELDVTELTASVSGLAIDVATKSAVIAELDRFGSEFGWQISSDVIAGPVSVSVGQVQAAIMPVTDCGPLTLSGDAAGDFGLSDVITMTGDVALDETRAAVSQSLAPLIGERRTRQELRVLNPQLCEIRAALGSVPTDVVSLSLSNGETGERNLSGVFTTGQNPVVDVVIPETFSEGALWVLVVNPDGSVFHVVPNIYNEEFRINELADVDAGLRRIRVLHSIEAFIEDNRKLAFRIQEGEYGKSEIIAILSTDSLFDGRRPTTESVTSTALALQEALETRPENILGVTSSIVDARP